jgi:hypothetical protein
MTGHRRKGWLARLFATRKLDRVISDHRQRENDVARANGEPVRYEQPPCPACHGDGRGECTCLTRCGRPRCTGRRQS